jgi:pSer/pThr/pTyr-binding forkhead associated (FHA) protein
MRIEVLVGNEDPIIFPLNSNKVSIGSSEHCDIVVNADGVSRKHVVIINEDDQFFVADQGSTNGSFINEERLIPGRKTEFTAFFPVRLGDNVLVSLLNDDEIDDLDEEAIATPPIKEISLPKTTQTSNSDTTRVISLADMKKIRTEDLVVKRNKKRQIKKKVNKKRKKKKENPSFISILSLGLLVAAVVYQFYFKEDTPSEVPVSQVGQIVAEAKTPIVKPKVNSDLIPDDELVPKETYNDLINNMKCIIDVEIHLCDLILGARTLPFGVTQVGLSSHIMLDGSSYIKEASAIVDAKGDSPEAVLKRKELILDTAIYLFLIRAKAKLNLTLLQDTKLFFAFYVPTEEGWEVARVLAIRPKVFNEKDEFVREQNLPFIQSSGRDALLLTDKKYKTY